MTRPLPLIALALFLITILSSVLWYFTDAYTNGSLIFMLFPVCLVTYIVINWARKQALLQQTKNILYAMQILVIILLTIFGFWSLVLLGAVWLGYAFVHSGAAI